MKVKNLIQGMPNDLFSEVFFFYVKTFYYYPNRNDA